MATENREYDEVNDSREVLDLIDALATRRDHLLTTVDGITDEQARERSTVSELTLGGLIKHVARTEKGWQDFARGEAEDDGIDWNAIDWENPDPAAYEALAAREAEFTLQPEETLADVVAEYRAITAGTAELLRTTDLNDAYPLPPAPWFEDGASWTVRQVALHIMTETAQHAGHADIIREAIDGAKTMG